MSLSVESSRKRILIGIIGFLLAAIPVFLIEKGSLVLFFQQFHSSRLDTFVFFITRCGEGYVLFPVLILLTILLPYPLKTRLSLIGIVLISVVGLLGIVQCLKQFVFDFPRPSAYFLAKGIQLLEVEGMQLHGKFSFPSGHTAGAFFSYCVFFYLLFGNTAYRYLWWIPAILVAFSRVYLGQHFLQDIWAGALIGFLLANLCIYFSRKYLDRKHNIAD